MTSTAMAFLLANKYPIAILSSLAALANLFAWVFIDHEKYVYYWDYAGYWVMYLDLGPSFLQSPLDTARRVLACVRECDYGPLPILPFVPIEWLLGGSRSTYVLAIVNLYLLPAALLMGVLVQRVVAPRALRASLMPVALAALCFVALNAMWAPALRGMPDVAGVLVIGVILLLHLSTPLTEQSIARLVLTGLALCVLVLVRRWYLFWVVAFFPAALVAHGWDIWSRPDVAWRDHIAAIRRLTIIGLCFALALTAAATPFVARALSTDYSDVYSAYRTAGSLAEVAALAPSHFGWVVSICGAAGLVYMATQRETRVVGSFLILQSLIAFVLFERVQDFGFHHFYILTPAVGLGIAALAIALWTKIDNIYLRAPSIGLVLGGLLVSFVASFAPGAAAISDSLEPIALLPKPRFYPLARNDLDQFAEITDRLEEAERERPGDIYVLASSEILNSSILQNFCRYGARRRSFCDRILSTNDIDKRDGFPQQFLTARYLLVASPTQYHMNAEDQRVVGVLAGEVNAGTGVGASFRRLAGNYRLDEGVDVAILEKVGTFDRESLDALAAKFSGYYPSKSDLFRVGDANQ